MQWRVLWNSFIAPSVPKLSLAAYIKHMIMYIVSMEMYIAYMEHEKCIGLHVSQLDNIDSNLACFP